MTSYKAIFDERLRCEWLPTYCHDSKRGYATEGFKAASSKVTEDDARDFLRGMDVNVITDGGGGRYRAPRNKVDIVIFWEGSRTKSPRPITLFAEPVIAIASRARLHLDFGWPKGLLGLESAKWEFDLVAFLPRDLNNEHIAGEVKKTVRQLEVLISHMKAFSPTHPSPDGKMTPLERNAFNKYKGLLLRRATMFWAIGPGGYSRLFEVTYPPDGGLSLNEIPIERLRYSRGMACAPVRSSTQKRFFRKRDRSRMQSHRQVTAPG
ncbi:MAG: hypothetical protein ACT4P0_01730 [Panacagrimonas sp.]